MSTTDQSQVFVAEAIRDQNIHNSDVADTGEFQAQTIVIYNDLDVNVTLQFQGSMDETNWMNIGSTWVQNTVTKGYQTVSDYFPYYRLTAVCSSTPTTGDLDAWILKSGAIN